jgi:SAM-dependent methyltransferase
MRGDSSESMINMGIPLKIDPQKPSHELYEDIDYRLFWSGWQQFKLDQAEHIVLRGLLPVSGRRLIDIGCGYGRLADCYLDRYDQVIMFDGSISLLRQAREYFGGKAVYVAGNLNRLPFRSASFDSAVMVRVFHHIMESEAFLKEINRILSGSGLAIITYNNKLYMVNVLKWLIHPTPNSPFSMEPSGIGTTIISHHPSYVKQILLQSGFTNLQFRGLGVLDRLANKIGLLGRFTPTGVCLAPFFGKVLIAPWNFCRAVAKHNPPLVESSKIEDILECITCRGKLRNQVSGFTCLSCGRYYPIIEGIFDFRPK